MKRTLYGLTLVAAALSQMLPGVADAKATAEEIARLGKDLTCVGAEKAGNKDGTIPEFSGKWLGAPPHLRDSTIT